MIREDIDLATLQLLCKKCGLLDFSAEYCIDLLSGVTSSLLSCNLAILGPRAALKYSNHQLYTFTKLKRTWGRKEKKEMKQR